MNSFAPFDHYDPRKGGYAGQRGLQHREEIAIRLISDLARTPGSFLDVGCGTGLFLNALDRSLALSTRGWRLHGVDYSEAQLDEARHLPYEFQQCNVETGLPFADASMAVMFCGEVIEHLYNPDGFLEECRRVISQDGFLLITTPNLHAWYNRLLFLAGIQPIFYETSTRSTHIGAGPLKYLKRGSIPVGHIRLFNRRAVSDLLESQGFSVLKVEGAIFPVLPAPVRAIDKAFCRMPSLASNLVVLCKRGA